jgi:orotidine-5'-phosphate decarboxylase
VKSKNLNIDTFYGVPEGATKIGVLTQFKWAKQNPNFSEKTHVLAMGRAKPKDHGAAKDKYFVGMPQGNVVVIEDVTTTGGSLINTIDSLQEAQINISAVISLTNRMEKRDDGKSVKQAVEEKGVHFYNMSSALNLLPIMYEKTQPGIEIAKSIESEFNEYGVEPLKLSKKNLSDLNIELTEKEKIARTKVCLPLDGLNTLEEVKNRVEELSPVVGMFKIGKELFSRFGPEVVNIVKSYGSEVFLDLKYHDIPNTVKGAANAATQLGVYMFNIHASGGLEMMKAAVEGADEACNNYNLRKPKIIGVTILTSIDNNILANELKIPINVENQVLNLALLSKQAGLDGVVCSAADLYAIKDKLPDNFMFVTPGIKGPNTPAGSDQKRVFTPGNAVQDGSTILVIGRAITGPDTREERIKAGHEVLKDIAGFI